MCALFCYKKFKKITSKKVFSTLLLFVFIFVNFFGFSVPTAHAVDAWKTGWTAWGYRVKITINASQVPSTQTNFPVYVNLANLPAGFWSGVKADGADIRVTNSAGTELAREIETINTGTSTGVLWFKADSISDASYYYIYYGNASAVEPAASADNGSQKVWDDGGSSYYKGVWHLPNGTTLTANDSTGVNNGTLSAAPPTAATGLMGGGAAGAVNKFIYKTSPTNLYFTAGDIISIEAWVKRTNTAGAQYEPVVSNGKSGAEGNRQFELDFNKAGLGETKNAIAFHFWGGGTYPTGAWQSFSHNAADTDTTNFHHYALTYTYGNAGSAVLYKDGAPITGSWTSGTGNATPSPAADTLYLMTTDSNPSGEFINGVVDEIRVSKGVTRSANWIATEYNNQNAPATFYAVSAQEAVTVPNAPTGLGGTAGNVQVSLAWTVPAVDGGSPITDYAIEYKLHTDVSWTQVGHIASTATSIVVNSGNATLVNGSLYDFRVFAVNVVGASASASNIVQATPATVPTAPAKGTATAGNTSASVAFTPPANGGSAITGYTVISSPGSFTGTGASSPIVVSGLTNGTAYTFTVTATNAMGTGPASVASNSATPATVPGAPTAVAATFGDRQVSLLWSAPASTGGSAITDYVIEYKLTSASDIPANWQISADPETPTIVATLVTGLVNGTSYDFRITARNVMGGGSPSSPLVNATPKTIPSKPTITSVTAGDMQATVNFTALSNPTNPYWYNNSWTLRKKITIDKTKVPNTNQTNFPVLVSLTGLSNINANGTDIRFTSADGATELPREIESYSAGTLVAWVKVPVLSTSANTDIYMYYGNSSANSEPVANSTYGKNNVWTNGYAGVWHLKETGTVTTWADSTSNGNNGTNNGVTTGTGQMGSCGSFVGSSNQYIRVTNSASLNSFTALTLSAWAKPTSAIVTNDIISKPTTDAAGPTSPYELYELAQVSNSTVWTAMSTNSSRVYLNPASPTTTGGQWQLLSSTWDGTTIRFYKNDTVSATTSAFTGPIGSNNIDVRIGAFLAEGLTQYFDGSIDEVRISSASRSADWIKTEYNNQSAPASFYAVAGEENVANSATNGGSAITNYTVTSSPGSFTGTGLASPIIVTGLTNGTPYTFTMTATNVVGQGPASSPAFGPVTPAGLPGIPTGLTATPGNLQVGLSWTAPANNGAEITNYVIEYKLRADSSWTQLGHAVSPLTTITVPDLVNGSLYDFRVSAVNSAGTGSSTTPTVESTPRTVPGQPSITSVERGDGQVTVNFTPLSNSTNPLFSAGWTLRKKITIDKTKVPNTNQTNFPVLVSLTGLSNINANGTDIRFTSADGITQLPREIESYSAGTLVAWVKVPVLSTSANTDIYMYYGNSSATTEPVASSTYGSQKVWDDGGNNYFKGVWHSQDTTTSTITNSVSGMAGTKKAVNEPLETVGSVGKAQQYDGTNDYINTTYVGNPYPITIEAIAKHDTGSEVDYPNLVGNYSSAAWNGWMLYVVGNKYQAAYIRDHSNYIYTEDGAGFGSIGTTPKYLAAVVDANGISLYTNGVYQYTKAWTGTPGATTQSNQVEIGRITNGSIYFGPGMIDETRISSTARSADWIATEYNNQSNPASFYSVAGEESVANSPNNGGAEVTSYTVTSSPQGITQTGSGSPIVIGGLTNGTAYTFTVKATNVAGTGIDSNPSSAITPAGVPGKARSVTAVAGNTQAVITFVEPLSTGGSAITGYTVSSNSGGTDTNSGSTNLSHIVTGLTNGQTYTFTVVATNDVGAGLVSDPSVAITLPTAPTAPLNLAAEVKSSSIKLTWSDPASTGGSPITGYAVEFKLTTGGSWAPFGDGTSIDKFATVTGLSNGTSYDFKVSAKNIVGTSEASSVVSANPGEPAQVRIMGFPDLTNTTISTDIKITNEGLIEYEYQYTWCVTDAVDNLCGGGNDIYSGSNAKSIATHTDFDTTLVSTVPTPGDYYFHINVFYGSASSYSFSSFTAVATFPDPPTGVSAVGGNAQASISFTIPASNGGSPITNYTVTSNPGALTGTGLTTPIIVTGLTNGTPYTFTMTATNIIGTGLSSSPPSNSVTPMTVPGIISGLTASAGNTQVGLSWTAPAQDGGSPILDYVIEFKLTSEADSEWRIFADPISTVTTAIVTGLTNNLSYDFRVKAVNAVGQGPINSASATSAEPPPANTGGGGGGGGYVRLPVIVPSQAPTTTPSIVPETVVPQTNLPTVPKSKPNEVSATPTETSKITLPVQASTDNSKKNNGTLWLWISVVSVAVVSAGFTFFILKRKRIDKK